MTSFSLEKSFTEAIYMVKSKKLHFRATVVCCSLLSLGPLQLVKSINLEKSLTEAIYMVKSKKMTFLSHF